MPLSDYKNCNWGKIPSHMIMVSGSKLSKEIQPLKDFLILIDELFGVNGKKRNLFFLYDSDSISGHDRKNLLFTDGSIGIKDIGTKNADYSWIGKNSFYVHG